MTFVSYIKTDTYYEFIDVNGVKTLVPTTDVVLVDDDSGSISVKNTASRRTIGIIIKQ